MAPSNRPSRLLNLNKSPKANRAISVSNATNSPFLKLPDELRHRIYRYTLGGQMIHIFGELEDQSGKYHLAVCAHPPFDDRGEPRQYICDLDKRPELNLSEFDLR